MPSEDAVRVEALSTGAEHMLSLVTSGSWTANTRSPSKTRSLAGTR
jgi:hypothetical protein